MISAKRLLVPFSSLILLCVCNSVAQAQSITIQPNDTLSGLVYKHYPNANNSLELMRQIHATNPDVFIDNNPNRLIIGKVINLPDLATPSIPSETTPLAGTSSEVISGSNSTLAAKISILEQEKSALNSQLKNLEDENAQLKVLIKRYENERQTAEARAQELEKQLKDLTLQMNTAASLPDLTDQLNGVNAQLKSAQAENSGLQKQLSDTQKLITERDQQSTAVRKQLQDLEASNKQVTEELQRTQALNAQLTYEMQKAVQNSWVPWLLAGLAALLLIPLLWLVRRRPQSESNRALDAAAITSVTKPLEPLRTETTLALNAPSATYTPQGLNEGHIKLNIARAYLDMRDANAAAEVLQEILREGNEQEKQQAREILSFIA